jgi:hypothetical protein
LEGWLIVFGMNAADEIRLNGEWGQDAGELNGVQKFFRGFRSALGFRGAANATNTTSTPKKTVELEEIVQINGFPDDPSADTTITRRVGSRPVWYVFALGTVIALALSVAALVLVAGANDDNGEQSTFWRHFASVWSVRTRDTLMTTYPNLAFVARPPSSPLQHYARNSDGSVEFLSSSLEYFFDARHFRPPPFVDNTTTEDDTAENEQASFARETSYVASLSRARLRSTTTTTDGSSSGGLVSLDVITRYDPTTTAFSGKWVVSTQSASETSLSGAGILRERMSIDDDDFHLTSKRAFLGSNAFVNDRLFMRVPASTTTYTSVLCVDANASMTMHVGNTDTIGRVSVESQHRIDFLLSGSSNVRASLGNDAFFVGVPTLLTAPVIDARHDSRFASPSLPSGVDNMNPPSSLDGFSVLASNTAGVRRQLFAQDVESVFPDAVHEFAISASGASSQLTTNGNHATTIKYIDNDVLLAHLIAALAEACATIRELRTDVDALKQNTKK